MPEGIVPELLIAVALIAIIVVAALASRSRRPARRDDRARPPAGGAPTVEAEAPQVEEPAAREAPPAVSRPTLRERLGKARAFLAERVGTALSGGGDEAWDDLEAGLIQADVGVATATRLVEAVRESAPGADPATVTGALADELGRSFDENRERALSFASSGPTVWLVVGVNGTGKTTTIGKLAFDLTARGRSVAMAAADTFRAAADEQLGIWAERAGAQMVKHQPGADPGAVAFDAFQRARARDIDVLIVDTAGRLHTKTPLMDELAKVRRVIEKDGEVHEVLLVIDATAGQNGLSQAREFAQAIGVSGVVLTKLDGSARGGIAVAIENELDIPIKLIGVGEGIDDLEPFEPKTFVDALLR